MRECENRKGAAPAKKKDLQKRRQVGSKDLSTSDYSLTQGFWIVPTAMIGPFDGEKELNRAFRGLMEATRNDLISEKRQSSVINEMFADVITGAYQDKIIAYSIRPSGTDEKKTEAIETIQRIRQKADMHLIRVIQAFIDMKRPPVKVVVKQARQVNVADKQINVAQSKESSK